MRMGATCAGPLAQTSRAKYASTEGARGRDEPGPYLWC
jgi:hypothetical protein